MLITSLVIRVMASRINQAFTFAEQSLTAITIENTLGISQIVEDFKVPDLPPPQNIASLFRNFAAGAGMADKIIKQVSGPAGDVIAFIGGIFNIVANNQPGGAPAVTDYTSLTTDLEQYLKSVLRWRRRYEPPGA